MLNDKELVLFNEKYAAQFKSLADLIKVKKDMEKKEKAIKAELEAAFEEYGITQLDNPNLKITFVKASETKSVDLNQLKKVEPGLYADLLNDYPEVKRRKAYVRFDVK